MGGRRHVAIRFPGGDQAAWRGERAVRPTTNVTCKTQCVRYMFPDRALPRASREPPMSDTPSTHRPDHDTRFTKGNPGGPGRPPGARNRASQRLILEILRDFELNRELVFHRLRSQHLQSYVSLVKAIMPAREEIAAADLAGDFDDIPLQGDDTEWRAGPGGETGAAARAPLAAPPREFPP